MFCSNCGKEIPEGTVFCSFCGANQGSAPTQAPAPQPQPPKRNNALILAIVAIVAVVAIVLGIFVIAPSLSGDKTSEGSTPTSVSTVKSTADNKTQTDTSDKKLAKLEYHLIDGKKFESDMGEYGKMQLSFGYDKDTGVVKQMTAQMIITPYHSEYESLKSDFIAIENKLKNMNDENNAYANYTEHSDYIECYYSFQNLLEADRAERVQIASEELDIPYRESNFAFYIDDITDTLVNEYGFVVTD